MFSVIIAITSCEKSNLFVYGNAMRYFQRRKKVTKSFTTCPKTVKHTLNILQQVYLTLLGRIKQVLKKTGLILIPNSTLYINSSNWLRLSV